MRPHAVGTYLAGGGDRENETAAAATFFRAIVVFDRVHVAAENKSP